MQSIARLGFLCILFGGWSPACFAARVAITIDDFRLDDSPSLTATEKDDKILAALKEKGVHAALFVVGSELERPFSRSRLSRWDRAGHLIGNHSYTHPNFDKRSLRDFSEELVRT